MLAGSQPIRKSPETRRRANNSGYTTLTFSKHENCSPCFFPNPCDSFSHSEQNVCKMLFIPSKQLCIKTILMDVFSVGICSGNYLKIRKTFHYHWI